MIPPHPVLYYEVYVVLRSLEHVKEMALGTVDTFGDEALWIKYDRNANSAKQIGAMNVLHNSTTRSGLTVSKRGSGSIN